MRKTEYKKQKTQSETKLKQFPNKPLALSVYFKDKNAIDTTITSLIELSNSNGWHILQSFLNEQLNNCIQALKTINPTDATGITKIQAQIEMITYLLSLPQFIINSFDNTGSEILDPYSHS